MERWIAQIARGENGITPSIPDSEEERRFVVHRHVDKRGAHLDVRLEEGDVLAGWRLSPDAPTRLVSGEEVACDLKRPHPVQWLDVDDAECTVEFRGTYRWLSREPGHGVAFFQTGGVETAVSFARREPEAATAEQGMVGCVDMVGERFGLDLGREDEAQRLVSLADDGMTARKRAIERLCAVGGELDGDTFDVGMWRTTLEHLSLDEIHAHLRSFERRFDEKYPPAPVTRPERLDSEADRREKVAAGILSEEFSLFE